MAGIAVGLVGHGSWGRHILRDLVALGCSVSVVTRDEGRQAAAFETGAASVVGHLDELPDGVRGIVVATPITTHAEVVDALLPRQVPLFVEKPLTGDAVSAARLAELAQDRLFIMDKWRYHPGVELLGDIARSQELGAVAGLRTVRVGWGNSHLDIDGVWVLVPHELSIALEVLGTIPEPRGATGEALNGATTGLVGLLGDDPWFTLEVSTAHPVRRREIRLVCVEGVAMLTDPYADHVLVTRGESVTREEEKRPISTELPLLRELRAFIEHLEGGPPPRSSAAEGAAEVAAVARLRELAGLDA